MNTTTMRIAHYLQDDEEAAKEINAFVQPVLLRDDCVALVSTWLSQRFGGVYENLEQEYIEWEVLARDFVREVTPIPDEHLPRLIVSLVDATAWAEEEWEGQSPPRVTELIDTVNRWLNELQAKTLAMGPLISYRTFLQCCRKAPAPFLLNALIVLYKALQTAALQAGDEAFWNEGGQGHEAYCTGKLAIERTWWPWHPFLRQWVDANKSSICAVLDAFGDVFAEQMRQQASLGVLEPRVASLRALRAYVFGER
jgi:hypothetical protein